MRAIILRHFDREPDRIVFATDVRSSKIAEIRRNPPVALTVNDAERSVQLRMEGRAAEVTDAVERERAWKSLRPHSRHIYDSPITPGTALDGDPAPDVAVERGETGEESLGFDRFAWVAINLEKLDWLDLSQSPQRRWQFTLDDGVWSGQPVAP